MPVSDAESDIVHYDTVYNCSGVHTVTINISGQRKAIFRKIKKMCFAKGGLIFGGMPRDEIIQEYYIALFQKYASHNGFFGKPEYSTKFWDTSIHPESAARTIVPNDADLFFKNHTSAMEFIDLVKRLFPGRQFEVPETPDNFTNNVYSGRLGASKIIVKKCCINYYAGVTQTDDGYLIKVPIDIVYPRNEGELIDKEPPFENCDMMCNIFVEDSHNSRRISNNSITWFKYLSTYEKTILTHKIIENMLKFKTDIIKTSSATRDGFVDIARYIKMMSRPDFPWTITNLPYDVIYKTPIEDDIDCCICQESLKDTSKDIAVINSVNSNNEKVQGLRLHHDCLMKSFLFQIKNAQPFHRRDKDKNNVMCPYKSIVNFDACIAKIIWKDKYLTM
jgi:hypothetical protein